jgi:hypothetical protein
VVDVNREFDSARRAKGMASTAQTSSVTTTQASNEVGGGPVPAAGERLLSLEPQAVDRRETARARNPAAVCRFRA